MLCAFSNVPKTKPRERSPPGTHLLSLLHRLFLLVTHGTNLTSLGRRTTLNNHVTFILPHPIGLNCPQTGTLKFKWPYVI